MIIVADKEIALIGRWHALRQRVAANQRRLLALDLTDPEFDRVWAEADALNAEADALNAELAAAGIEILPAKADRLARLRRLVDKGSIDPDDPDTDWPAMLAAAEASDAKHARLAPLYAAQFADDESERQP